MTANVGERDPMIRIYLVYDVGMAICCRGGAVAEDVRKDLCWKATDESDGIATTLEVVNGRDIESDLVVYALECSLNRKSRQMKSCRHVSSASKIQLQNFVR